jgi:hypothetical protein
MDSPRNHVRNNDHAVRNKESFTAFDSAFKFRKLNEARKLHALKAMAFRFLEAAVGIFAEKSALGFPS